MLLLCLGFGRGDDGHVLVRHLLRRDLDLVVVLVGVEREYLVPCAVVTDEAPAVDAGVVAQPEHDGIVSVQRTFMQGFHALREGLIRPKVPKQLILGLSAFAESRTLFLGALVDLDAFVEHPGAVTHNRLVLCGCFSIAIAVEDDGGVTVYDLSVYALIHCFPNGKQRSKGKNLTHGSEDASIDDTLWRDDKGRYNQPYCDERKDSGGDLRLGASFLQFFQLLCSCHNLVLL